MEEDASSLSRQRGGGGVHEHGTEQRSRRKCQASRCRGAEDLADGGESKGCGLMNRKPCLAQRCDFPWQSLMACVWKWEISVGVVSSRGCAGSA